jgi:AcrR family transcriptional regulator
MARPRVLNEDRLLDAAAQELAEVGPAAFTLAGAADRADASAATYIKRFGSRHGVFLALNRRWADRVVAGIDSAVATHQGVDRVREAVLWGVHEMDMPAHAVNNLAVFALDLTHSDMRAILQEGWMAQHQKITELLTEVMRDGLLAAAPQPDQAARMLIALVEGTRIAWCVHPEGSLESVIRRHVDALLGAWT